MSYLDMYKGEWNSDNDLKFLICAPTIMHFRQETEYIYRVVSWYPSSMTGYLFAYSDPAVEIEFKFIDNGFDGYNIQSICMGHRYDDVIFIHPFKEFEKVIQYTHLRYERVYNEANNYFRTLDKLGISRSEAEVQFSKARASYEPRSYEYLSRSIDYRRRHYPKFEY